MLTQVAGRKNCEHTPLAQFTHLLGADGKQQRVLANLEVFLRSKRVYTSLMEQYNPLYGMSEQERIRATARTVGLDVPEEKQ